MRRPSGCAIGFGIWLLVVAGVGGFWLFNSIQTVTSSDRVEGEIVELVASTDTDGDTLYAPVVAYVVDGERYRIQSNVRYGGLAVPDIGDRRTVYYDPDDPSDATFRGFWTLWFWPGLLLGLPIVIIAAMVGAGAYARRGESDPDALLGAAPVFTGLPDESPVVSGTEVVADFMGVEVSEMDDAGRVRYRVRAQAEIGDVIHRFEGPWADEDQTLEYMRAGNRVRIRIDPADPGRYEVLGPGSG